ncbi:MAG: hypothetical protein AAF492_22005, partial [Verrucomicrobiota bacterium]
YLVVDFFDNMIFSSYGERRGKLCHGLADAPERFLGAVFGADGRVYLGRDDDNKRLYEILVLKRGYRTMDVSTNDPPVIHRPVVARRPGTMWLDIDYYIEDADDATVHAAALAFIDGSNDLDHVIRVNTLVDGTQTNIGPGVHSGVGHTITWDVGADWPVGFGTLEVEILAKDDRDVLGFHFLTLPANGTNTEMTISRSPVTEDDMLNLWYWMIATNDPAVNLTNGSVLGVGGAYDNVLLATGRTTSAQGRGFLFDRLNVREAMSQEILYAKEALTPGVTNAWVPDNRIGRRPWRVNELGFDTGAGTEPEAPGGWWVIPVSP